MTTIYTNHGEFTGRTVESIIRREYGRKATFRPSANPNSPEAGMIVEPNAYDRQAFNVLATVYSWEGKREARED